MTYPPQQHPVMPGHTAHPPAGDWQPPKPTSRTVPILIGAVVVLVLAVAGLAFVLLSGNNDKPATPTATTSTPASPAATIATAAAPATFSSAADLRLALVAGGIACNNAELIAHDGKGPVGLIDDTISCYRDAAELDLDVYDSAANASGRVAYQAALLDGFGLDPDWFAIGQNWTVLCETRTDCEAVTAAIGGRVESTE